MSDIDWPAGWDRTDPRDREPNNCFEVTLRASVDDWRLSTDAEHQTRNPNYPYADANPRDPGAAVYWSMDGEQFAVACDAYSRLRDNVRTRFLYLREKRKMEQRPVRTGESEFANARLPPGDKRENGVVDERDVLGSIDPHDILGVPARADAQTIRERARELKKQHYPDAGGHEDGSSRSLQPSGHCSTGENLPVGVTTQLGFAPGCLPSPSPHQRMPTPYPNSPSPD